MYGGRVWRLRHGIWAGVVALAGDGLRVRCRYPARGIAAERQREEGAHLPCHVGGEEPVHRERACDREQRRPQGRPPRPHGPGLPGGGLGRHHPAVRLRGRQGRHADLPRLQLDAGGAGDLGERLRGRPESRSYRYSSASTPRRTAGSWRTSATRTRTPTSWSRRSRTRSSPTRRIEASRRYSSRAG